MVSALYYEHRRDTAARATDRNLRDAADLHRGIYQAIRKHPTARQRYAEWLEREGVIRAGEAAALVEQYRVGLDEGKPQARAFVGTTGNASTGAVRKNPCRFLS